MPTTHETGEPMHTSNKPTAKKTRNKLWISTNGEPELFAGAWFAEVINGGPRMTPAQPTISEDAGNAASVKDH